MPIERTRALARFFGYLMLTVQLWVLYAFVGQVERDVDITHWEDRVTLLKRMAWLKPPLWSESWQWCYAILMSLTCGSIVVGLAAAAVIRWRRALREEGDAR
jgi:hypothetical protein